MTGKRKRETTVGNNGLAPSPKFTKISRAPRSSGKGDGASRKASYSTGKGKVLSRERKG